MRKYPRDAQCPHCKRFFTRKGLKEHLRHVRCSPTSTATKRVFERARCRYCGKSFHSGNSLRVHVAGQHPPEYSKSPHSVKHHKAPLKRKSAPKLEQQRPRSASPHAKRKRDTSRQPQETEHSTTDLRAGEDPERARRVWEEVLRRQQLQRDTTGRKHHAHIQDR
jgi:hypothetical protein